MTYCEIIKSSCARFLEGDTGHCNDCGESMIAVLEGIESRGLGTQEVQIIFSSSRHDVGAYEKSTGLLVIGVTQGHIRSR